MVINVLRLSFQLRKHLFKLLPAHAPRFAGMSMAEGTVHIADIRNFYVNFSVHTFVLPTAIRDIFIPYFFFA